MTRRTTLFAGLVAIVLGLAIGMYAYAQADRMIAVAQVPVPAVDIPPYTLIQEGMLGWREVPRSLLAERIVARPEQVVGRIAVVPLYHGQVIYPHYLRLPEGFRFTADPTMEVVSFPVEPERAVGGQVRIGQRINIYALNRKGGGGWPVAQGVPVVDVRGPRGQSVEVKAGSYLERELNPASQAPVAIITVAVPAELAMQIATLAASSDTVFWVTLAPLGTEMQVLPTPTPTAAVMAAPTVAGGRELVLPPTQTPTPTPTPVVEETPEPTPTPEPSPAAVVYRVQPGDTLLGIAKEHGLSLDELLALNPGLSREKPLTVGQEIVVRAGPAPTATPAAGLSPTATAAPTATPTATPTPAPAWEFAVATREVQPFGSNTARILVLDAQGAPLPGIGVRLSYCCPAGSLEAVTGGDGWCEFMLTPGQFHLELPGHTSEPVTIDVSPEGGTALYIIHMRRTR